MEKTKTAILFATALLVMLVAKPSYAQVCETPAEVTAATAASISAQTAAVTGMTTAISLAVETSTSLARSVIVTGLDVVWFTMRDRLNQFWLDWQEAQKGQIAQIHAGTLDQTRQQGSVLDASMLGEARRAIETQQMQARRNLIFPEELCRFDSDAVYTSRAMRTSRAVAVGGARDTTARLSGRQGSISGRGPAAATAARMDLYRTVFCNPNNSGGAGCAATVNPMTDAHVLPSKTFFGSETLRLDDPNSVAAINELTHNLVGYKVPPLKSPEVLQTAAGREQRWKDREVMAQMDASAGLVWGIVGERAPAGPAPEVQQMRLRMGQTDPSANPSEYEIRQNVIEQLWDPAYYANLQDGSAATRQKEIYLKAYALMQMNKLIEKMERIGTVYAVQTSNILEQANTTNKGRQELQPLRN